MARAAAGSLNGWAFFGAFEQVYRLDRRKCSEHLVESNNAGSIFIFCVMKPHDEAIAILCTLEAIENNPVAIASYKSVFIRPFAIVNVCSHDEKLMVKCLANSRGGCSVEPTRHNGNQ